MKENRVVPKEVILQKIAQRDTGAQIINLFTRAEVINLRAYRQAKRHLRLVKS